jgi:SPP1 family predicted phage head-tail adaptor
MKLKDKKIEILAVTITKDPEGFATETYTPIHEGTLWAYFRQLSGQEIFASEAVHATEGVLFTVNYRNDVTSGHVVRYNGVLYDIIRVDVFEGYKNDITLYAKVRS